MGSCRQALVILAACVLLAASVLSCGGQPVALPSQLKVVTTSNIIADWVEQVGGDRVSAFALLQPGADPHTFQPGAQDVARVAQARLVFTVGLGLERAWLNRLLENATADPDRVVALGDYVDPLPAVESGTAEEEDGLFDPHFWWDPLRVKLAVSEIERQLAAADPAGAETYARNGAGYRGDLDGLHARIVERVGEIKPQRRMLVTSHETMGYFAVRYGFEAVGSVFPGISTEREPSPAELVELVRRIRELGAPAIFTETIVSDKLARGVAGETDVKIIRLYSDSLGTRGSGADTYIRMMDSNVEAIFQALK